MTMVVNHAHVRKRIVILQEAVLSIMDALVAAVDQVTSVTTVMLVLLDTMDHRNKKAVVASNVIVIFMAPYRSNVMHCRVNVCARTVSLANDAINVFNQHRFWKVADVKVPLSFD